MSRKPQGGQETLLSALPSVCTLKTGPAGPPKDRAPCPDALGGAAVRFDGRRVGLGCVPGRSSLGAPCRVGRPPSAPRAPRAPRPSLRPYAGPGCPCGWCPWARGVRVTLQRFPAKCAKCAHFLYGRESNPVPTPHFPIQMNFAENENPPTRPVQPNRLQNKVAGYMRGSDSKTEAGRRKRHLGAPVHLLNR